MSTTTTSDTRTVSLSAHQLRLVRGLVEQACMRCSPSDMRRVIDLDRLSALLDDALDRC